MQDQWQRQAWLRCSINLGSKPAMCIAGRTPEAVDSNSWQSTAKAPVFAMLGAMLYVVGILTTTDGLKRCAQPTKNPA